MIAFVLNQSKRKIDVSASFSEKISDAATILIEGNGDLKSLVEYHHHILIVSDLPVSEKDIYLALADATPKSGGIFYDDTSDLAKSIAKKERPDVTVFPFTVPKHEMQNGKAVLIIDKEKFPTQLSSEDDLKSCSAAKELLSKIGITSAQFYNSIATFQ